MTKIKNNIEKLRSEVDESKVKIVAVSKYVEEGDIEEAYNSGIRDFGESKAVEALRKRENLSEEVEKNSTWHFIGRLQTNKVKKVVGKYEYIHSVDSLKLAQVIAEEAEKQNIVQKILLQINISEEESKTGIRIKQIKDVIEKILSLNYIKVVGLMTMAPLSQEESQIKKVFAGLREIREKINKEYNTPITELSMGMSSDYKIAIEEGSTIIRLGNKVFN